VANKFKLSDRDNGAKALREALSAANVRVDVGILGPKAAEPHGHDATVADIAGFNEFGTRRRNYTVLPRSFIGGWFDSAKSEMLDFVRTLNEKLAKFEINPIQYGQLLGAKAVGGINKFIRAGVGAPLAPSTVKKKGSSKQLIDTGVMRSALSHRTIKLSGK
jgi:hypothetical protein